jgi:hypothetical protein
VRFKRGELGRKLMPKWVGPFVVLERIGAVAYKLRLPTSMKVHNVFHVSLIKPYRSDGRVQPPPPIEIDGEQEFEASRIIDHRTSTSGGGEKTKYLVRWQGYGPDEDTWQSEASLHRCQDSIAEYWNSVNAHAKLAQERSAAKDSERRTRRGAGQRRVSARAYFLGVLRALSTEVLGMERSHLGEGRVCTHDDHH